MRRIFLIALLAIGIIASAQDNIQFGIGEAQSTSDISEEAKNVLKSKLSQILNRHSAAAGGDYGVFKVVPTLDVGDAQSTSGLVKNVVQIEGSVVLTAENEWDNSQYYTVSVPLTAVVSGSVKDPALMLARSIKITDPVYMRFIKKSRENISRALEQDCTVTVERAQSFITAGYEDYALAILLALPPGNACNDLSQDLIGSIRALREADEQKKEDKERELRAEKMKLAEMKIKSGSDTESDVNTDEVISTDSGVENAEIFISDPAWTLKVLSCKWIPENRRVSVGLKVENKNTSDNSYYFEILNAIADSGDTYGWNSFVTSSYTLNVPPEVPVKCGFDIKCNSNPQKLSFVKFRIGSVTFEIKNLPVASN